MTLVFFYKFSEFRVGDWYQLGSKTSDIFLQQNALICIHDIQNIGK